MTVAVILEVPFTVNEEGFAVRVILAGAPIVPSPAAAPVSVVFYDGNELDPLPPPPHEYINIKIINNGKTFLIYPPRLQ